MILISWVPVSESVWHIMYLILLFQMTKPNLIVSSPGIYGEVEAQF